MMKLKSKESLHRGSLRNGTSFVFPVRKVKDQGKLVSSNDGRNESWCKWGG